MKDYDLDKIATKVKEIYKKTGIWPDYVELPRSSYHDIFGHDETQGSQILRVMVHGSISGEDFISKLFYRPSDGDEPIIRWSKRLYNPDVVKDKKHPPNLRYVPVVERCGNCSSSTIYEYKKDEVKCHRYNANLSINNCCDDWRKNV